MATISYFFGETQTMFHPTKKRLLDDTSNEQRRIAFADGGDENVCQEDEYGICMMIPDVLTEGKHRISFKFLWESRTLAA